MKLREKEEQLMPDVTERMFNHEHYIQMYEKKRPTLKQIVPQNHIWLQQ